MRRYMYFSYRDVAANPTEKAKGGSVRCVRYWFLENLSVPHVREWQVWIKFVSSNSSKTKKLFSESLCWN